MEEWSPLVEWNYNGDVHPTEKATIITGRAAGLYAEDMRWGIPGENLLINARVETVMERRVFSTGIRKHRCVIPASHFYEWNRDKDKVTFTLPGQPLLYMAGFYDHVDGEDRFVILTKAANDSMQPVHGRMPLILGEDEIRDWIFRDDKTRQFLAAESPELDREQEFEQMSLF